jgi:RNA polymerase sigma-70 factor (ECF subfamily)
MDELARRMLDSEESALYEFFEEFCPRIEAFFRSCGMPRLDAEILAPECVMKIISLLKKGKYEFRREGGFQAWAYKVARRQQSDWWKTHRPTDSIDGIEETLSLDNSLFPSPPEFESLVPDEITLAVRAAVAQLSPDDQEIIRLRHLDFELSYDEIGSRLGISADSAKVRCWRARKKLEKVLKGHPLINPLISRPRQEVASV